VTLALDVPKTGTIGSGELENRKQILNGRNSSVRERDKRRQI
jgi:hypothetical protein